MCNVQGDALTLREAMSGGGSRAAARAFISGMPLVGGDSIMLSSSHPMLASDVDLGMGVSFSGVTGIGSA